MIQPYRENNPPAPTQSDPDQAWLQTIKAHVESLKFGAVHIVIQDSRVVEIDRTEKIRFDQSKPSLAGDLPSRGSPHSRNRILRLAAR
jgi:hypothetical protein